MVKKEMFLLKLFDEPFKICARFGHTIEIFQLLTNLHWP